MDCVIRPVASLQELAQVLKLAGAQLPQQLTRHDRRKGLGRRLLQEVEAAARRLGASEISPGASGPERGFYLRMGYSGRTRLRRQLPLPSSTGPRRAQRWRRDLDELRRQRQRRLAAREP